MRNAIRKAPRASVTASKLFPEASFTALTVTPGSTAAVESVTVPLIVASCARPTAGIARIVRIEQTRINRPIALAVTQTSSLVRVEHSLGSGREFQLAGGWPVIHPGPPG